MHRIAGDRVLTLHTKTTKRATVVNEDAYYCLFVHFMFSPPPLLPPLSCSLSLSSSLPPLSYLSVLLCILFSPVCFSLYSLNFFFFLSASNLLLSHLEFSLYSLFLSYLSLSCAFSQLFSFPFCSLHSSTLVFRADTCPPLACILFFFLVMFFFLLFPPSLPFQSLLFSLGSLHFLFPPSTPLSLILFTNFH